MAKLKAWRSIPAAGARLPTEHIAAEGAFPGLDPQWSRLVTAKTDDGARTFHVLDTGPELAERGITPTGTILAVHGNPTWSYLWRRVLAASLEQAAEGRAWRVIAPDQLDMGFSDRLEHPEAPAAEAESYRRFEQRLGDLDGLMDALDVDTSVPLVTLGHDWGGVISMGWAMRHADEVDAVVSLNTAVDHPVDEHVPAALRAAMAPAVLPISTVETEGFLKVTLGLAEGGLESAVKKAYRAPYTSRWGRGGIGGFVADIPALSEHVSRPVLEETSSKLTQWQKPTLFLWGPQDPVFQDRYLADLLERLTHADVHRFEGSGHLLAEDRNIAARPLPRRRCSGGRTQRPALPRAGRRGLPPPRSAGAPDDDLAQGQPRRGGHGRGRGPGARRLLGRSGREGRCPGRGAQRARRLPR